MNASTFAADLSLGRETKTSADGGFLPRFVESMRSIFVRRWPLAVAVFIGVVTPAAAYLHYATPQFSATARMKIDPSRAVALGNLDGSTTPADQQFVDTEVNEIRSLAVARAVVEELDLAGDRALLAALDVEVPASRQERASEVAALLARRLQVTRRNATYMVDLQFADADPVKAAAIANAFADQYIRISLGRRSTVAAGQAEVLSARLDQLNDRAQDAEQRLAQYRASAGVIHSAGGASSTVIEQQLANLAVQQATAQSDAAAARARLRAAEAQRRAGGIEAVSEVLTSDVVARLRDQRATLMKSRDDIMVRYGPRHPQAQVADAQLRSIDQQIREESERIFAGLGAEAESADARALSLRRDFAGLERQRMRDTRSSAYAELYEREAESAQSAYDRLAERAEVTDHAAHSPLASAQIVERALPPDTPVWPDRPLVAAAASLLGLFFAAGSMALAEALSSRFTDAADVERLGLPLIGAIQRARQVQIARHVGPLGCPPDLLLACPFSSYTESVRIAATALGMTRRGKVLAVVSSLPDEGKSTVALSLARSLALSGRRVLAVDADLRRAGLTRIAGVRAGCGIVELLQGAVGVEAATYGDRDTSLRILPVAEAFAPVESPFSGEGMLKLLRELRQSYDAIIIDTPPVIGLADGREVARLADLTALVIRWNATSQKAARHTLDILEGQEGKIAGVILSMVGKASDTFGGRYYSRKYRHYYRDA